MVPYRLGFAVKVLGEGGIPSADTRRWQSEPHLRHSIDHLERVVEYLERVDVSVYRLSSQVIPYGTHPDLPQFAFERQLEEAAEPLARLGARMTALRLRLSTHPGQYSVLNATDDSIAGKAARDLEQDAALLDALEQGPEGTVVIHVGGLYDDRAAALDRWVARFESLSEGARARVGLENDERLFGLDDVLAIHERTGVRVVFDVHHHRLHPAGREIPLTEALRLACATWPAGVRPKVHLSSARTMFGSESRPRASGRGTETRTTLPALAQHADLVTPWDLEAVVRAAPVPLDIMLEAKGKDLALLWLRRTTTVVTPDVAALEERRR